MGWGVWSGGGLAASGALGAGPWASRRPRWMAEGAREVEERERAWHDATPAVLRGGGSLRSSTE